MRETSSRALTRFDLPEPLAPMSTVTSDVSSSSRCLIDPSPSTRRCSSPAVMPSA